METPSQKAEPKRVRLTQDYLDLVVGLGYPAGTILIRGGLENRQYMPEGTPIGSRVVAGYDLIEG